MTGATEKQQRGKFQKAGELIDMVEIWKHSLSARMARAKSGKQVWEVKEIHDRNVYSWLTYIYVSTV